MHYYIDGYNLLFRLLRKGDDLRKQREELIQEIELKINSISLDATLVFDSHYQEDESTRSYIGNLEIVFTAAGETADEFILQELKEIKTPGKHTIVTSDKKLSWLCRRRLAHTESVEEFISWLNKRYKNKLRQQKKPLKKTQPLTPLAPSKARPTSPAPDEISNPPKKENSAEECFDYYLEIFEQHIIHEAKPSKKDSTSTKQGKHKRKKKIREISKEETYLSDMQRWQNAFEKGPQEES